MRLVIQIWKPLPSADHEQQQRCSLEATSSKYGASVTSSRLPRPIECVHWMRDLEIAVEMDGTREGLMPMVGIGSE